MIDIPHILKEDLVDLYVVEKATLFLSYARKYLKKKHYPIKS